LEITVEKTVNAKIPPPIVGFLVAVLILLANKAFPAWQFSSAPLRFFAIAFVVIGLLIELHSIRLFFRSHTTVNPLTPEKSKTLVTIGMYRYSRNPMYLGMLLLLCGFSLWLANPAAIALLAFFVWYITRFQITPEEKVLTELFGAQYNEYAHRVRRWI